MAIVVDDASAYDYFDALRADNLELARQDRKNRKAMLEILLSARRKKILDAREYYIIKMHYNLTGFYATLEQLARHFNVNRERIRQIENKAILKLKKIHHTEVE